MQSARHERLAWFPEGTFTRMPGLLAFHLGAFEVACQAGVPIVPVAIRGTRSILRVGPVASKTRRGLGSHRGAACPNRT